MRLVPINCVITNKTFSNKIIFHYDYKEKFDEIKRIIGNNGEGKFFQVSEIQTKDIYEAARSKAIDAWEKNNHEPIIVEDNTFNVLSLDGFPGTSTPIFLNSMERKRLLCDMAYDKKDTRTKVITVLSVFDGVNTRLYEGVATGAISRKPKGSKGIFWDDIFIPDGQPNDEKRTFGQMEANEKDKYSMRKKAWNSLLSSPLTIYPAIYSLPEPYNEELKRIRYRELSKNSFFFATKVESLQTEEKPGYNYHKYSPVLKQEKKFYCRYYHTRNSPSLGLILTNIDLNRLQTYSNNEPLIWQMGPLRRKLAVAQRALYFDQNQNQAVYNLIEKYESGKITIPPRPNKRIRAVEKALGKGQNSNYSSKTTAISELGYKKIRCKGKISRREILFSGLFNIIGKYPRKIIGLGSMPPVTGWRDTLVMAAIGHMVCFIPRNSIFASDVNRRINLVKSAKEVIDQLPIKDDWKSKIKRNIGASIGLGNLKQELRTAKILNKEAGISLFRLYTIGADDRLIEIAKALRSELGPKIEIFVGQIADKYQAKRLIKPDIKVDALVFGHGGGQQCTSAVNGMAITTLEDVYDIVTNPHFNQTSLLVEGGVDRSIGTILILGVDGSLGNQKLVHGTIETGDIFVQHNKGKICQPYPGSASPVTQLIESEDDKLREGRSDASGRVFNPEGKPGYMFFEKKANSMAFWINEYLGYAARTLADLGVRNISELRNLLSKDKREFLRIMTEKTQYMSHAYGNNF